MKKRQLRKVLNQNKHHNTIKVMYQATHGPITTAAS